MNLRFCMCRPAGWLCAAVMLGALCSPHAHAADAVPQDDAPTRTVVFVGERVAIEPRPDPCQEKAKATGTLDCISMDALYRATYRVVQPLVGEVAGEALEFSISDHYGFPYFGHFGYALLFVEVGDDGAWLHKYQGIPLLRTVDGQWAACGDLNYRSDEHPLVATARPMAFAQPLLRLGDLDADTRDRLVAGWKENPQAYRIDGDAVHCLKGVPLDAAYAIVRDGVMAAREVPLPPWPAPR